MNIYFRTNCNNKIGLGHLSRTVKIAEYFKKKGLNCIFYVDQLKNLGNFKIKFPIFEIKRNYKFRDQARDAKEFLKNIKSSEGYIFLDDYRLGNTWKKIVKKSKFKLIYLSDKIEKEKIADFVVNYKINANEIEKRIKYNEKTKYLLGTKYALIEDQKSNSKNKFAKFNIVLYLGGSGDLKILKNLAHAISAFFKRKRERKILIKVIVGPLMRNSDCLKSISKKNNYIEVIRNEQNLIGIYKRSHLFIGSSGTSVYETNYANIPTVLFKYAKNQDDTIENLEKLGHFIHLKNKEIQNYKKVAELTYLIFRNYKRIKNLTKLRKVKIDGNGTKRIFSEIFKKKNKLKKKLLEKKRDSKLKFRKALDSDLNKILFLRNQKQNRLSSLNNRVIDNLDHYIWWFKSKRSFYLMYHQNLVLMSFWKKICNIGINKTVLTGWNSVKNISFLNVLHGVLKFNATIDKKYRVLSIVNKNNKVSLKIDKYLGYKRLKNIDLPTASFLNSLKVNLNKFLISIK